MDTISRKRRESYRAQGNTRSYTDPKKRFARHFIAEAWRAFSGLPSIPEGRQYITLGGPMTTSAGRLHRYCELRQLVEIEQLVRPHQVVVVNWKKKVQARNLRAVHRMYPTDPPTLHCDDIVDVLLDYLSRGVLNAAVVYLDTINESCNATRLLTDTLNILNHIDGPTMVCWNAISERHYPRLASYPWDAVRDLLSDDMLFQSYYRHGWRHFPKEDAEHFKFLSYDPSTATQMTSCIFVRDRPACGDDCKCSA